MHFAGPLGAVVSPPRPGQYLRLVAAFASKGHYRYLLCPSPAARKQRSDDIRVSD